MSETFQFGREVEKPRWLVKDLIPLGHLCLLLAQSGVGKSFLGEGLAIHIAAGRSFCGMDVAPGNVYIIDQDTPTNVLETRLNRFAAGLALIPEHKLEYDSMKGFALDDDSLINALKKHSDATFILIDSLHSVCGKLDPNTTQGMSIWARVKAECLRPDCTIMLVHHLSEKMVIGLSELMNANLHLSAMGNSVIKQQADTEYILGGANADGTIDRLYLRCNAKRQVIPTQTPIFIMEEPDEQQITFTFGGYYAMGITESEADVMLLLQTQENILRDYTIKQMKELLGNKWGETAIRKALASLEKRGKVVMGRTAHDMFHYRLVRSAPLKPLIDKSTSQSTPAIPPEPATPPASTEL